MSVGNGYVRTKKAIPKWNSLLKNCFKFLELCAGFPATIGNCSKQSQSAENRGVGRRLGNDHDVIDEGEVHSGTVWIGGSAPEGIKATEENIVPGETEGRIVGNGGNEKSIDCPGNGIARLCDLPGVPCHSLSTDGGRSGLAGEEGDLCNRCFVTTELGVIRIQMGRWEI